MAARKVLKNLLPNLKSKGLTVSEKVLLIQNHIGSISDLPLSAKQLLVDWIFQKLSKIYRHSVKCSKDIKNGMWTVAEDVLHIFCNEKGASSSIQLPNCVRDLLANLIEIGTDAPLSCFRTWRIIFDKTSLCKVLTMKFKNFVEVTSGILEKMVSLFNTPPPDDASMKYMSTAVLFVNSLLFRLQEVMKARTNNQQLASLFCKHFLQTFVLLHNAVGSRSESFNNPNQDGLRENVVITKDILLQVSVHILCRKELFVDLEPEYQSTDLTEVPKTFSNILIGFNNLAKQDNSTEASIIDFSTSIYREILERNFTWKLLPKNMLLRLFRNLLDSVEWNNTNPEYFVDLCASLIPLLIAYDVCTTSGDKNLGDAVTNLSLHVASGLFNNSGKKVSQKRLCALNTLLSVSHTFAEPFMTELLKQCLVLPSDSHPGSDVVKAQCSLIASVAQKYSDLKQLSRFFELFIDGIYYVKKCVNEDTKVQFPTGLATSLERVMSNATPSQVIQGMHAIVDTIFVTYLPEFISMELHSNGFQLIAALQILLSLLDSLAKMAKNITSNEYSGNFDSKVESFLKKGDKLCTQFQSFVAPLQPCFSISIWTSILALRKTLLEVAFAMEVTGHVGTISELKFNTQLGCFLPEYFPESDSTIFEDVKIKYVLSEIFICTMKQWTICGKDASVKCNIIDQALHFMDQNHFQSCESSFDMMTDASFGASMLNLIFSHFPFIVPILSSEAVMSLCVHLSNLLLSGKSLQPSKDNSNEKVMMFPVAKQYLLYSGFYEPLVVQFAFLNALFNGLCERLVDFKDQFVTVLHSVVQLNTSSLVDMNSQGIPKLSQPGDKEDSLTWVNIPQLIFSSCAVVRSYSVVSYESICALRKFVDACQLLDISRLHPTALSSLCCAHLLIVQSMRQCILSNIDSLLIEDCLYFISHIADLAVKRNLISCWSLLSAKQICKWLLTSFRTLCSATEKLTQTLLSVIFKFRGPREELTLQNVLKDFINSFFESDNIVMEKNLISLNRFISTAVETLHKKPLSDYTKHSTLQLSKHCLPAIIHVIDSQCQIKGRSILHVALSCLGRYIEVYSLASSVGEIFDEQQFKDSRIEDSVSRAFSWIQDWAAEVSPVGVDEDAMIFIIDFLRVLIDYLPTLQSLASLSGDFWSNVYSAVLNYLMVVDLKDGKAEKGISADKIYAFFASALIQTEDITRDALLEILSSLFLSGLSKPLLRGINVKLWLYLMSCNWKKDKKHILKPIASKIFLYCIQFMNDLEASDPGNLVKDLLVLITKFIGYGHGLLPSSVVMSSLNIYLDKELFIMNPKGNIIIKCYYDFLSTLLFKHSGVFENCVHVFLRHLHNLLLMVLQLQKSLLSKQSSHSLNKGEVTECFIYMGRLYQEIGSHKDIFTKYTPYLLSDYLRTTKNISLPSALETHLNSGIYIIMDSCGEHQLALLHTVLGPDEKDIFKNLYRDYQKYHKYQGKA